MSEDPKNDFDVTDSHPSVSPTEFDSPELDITPPEPRPINKDLDHEARIEQGKTIGRLENRMRHLEEQLDETSSELKRLRKLMEVWVNGH